MLEPPSTTISDTPTASPLGHATYVPSVARPTVFGGRKKGVAQGIALSCATVQDSHMLPTQLPARQLWRHVPQLFGSLWKPAAVTHEVPHRVEPVPHEVVHA